MDPRADALVDVAPVVNGKRLRKLGMGMVMLGRRWELVFVVKPQTPTPVMRKQEDAAILAYMLTEQTPEELWELGWKMDREQFWREIVMPWTFEVASPALLAVALDYVVRSGKNVDAVTVQRQPKEREGQGGEDPPPN